MSASVRDEMLDHLAEVIAALTTAHPTRVAIDGPPAAGKTTLADELAVLLRVQGRDVIRATIDDFLFPRAQRYPRGEYSGESCYDDAHDYDALTRVLLDPLGPAGDRRFQTAVYDRSADVVDSPPAAIASDDTVLIFDGVFLMRPELNHRWDLRIFVSTALDQTVERAVTRESSGSSADEVRRRWRERYLPAQQLYFAAVRPAEVADIVIDNGEPHHPVWVSQTH